MELRHVLLAVLFGIHWIAFVIVFLRSRRVSLLLPIAVFTLLVTVQFLAGSAVMLELGPLPATSLRTALRVTAIALAVPSIGMMVMRVLARRAARELAPEAAVAPAE